MALLLKSLLATIWALAFPCPLLADAIDGNWCHNDGRHFSIRGREIVTPGGATMIGDYSRHWFSYVVPVPEPGAGNTIFMTLMNENTIHLKREPIAASYEVWVRCSPSISAISSWPSLQG